MRMVSASNCPPQACKNDLSVAIHIGCLGMWRCTGDTRRGGEKRFVLSHVIYHVQNNTPTRIERTRVSDGWVREKV